MASREIADTAVRLFVSQGYEETTIAQIAREAGVSQRTLFRYFGTKEDLVCGTQDELGHLLVRTVREQATELSAWGALRAGFTVLLTANHSLDETLTLSTLIFRTPALHASYVQKRLGWQFDLMPVVRERLKGAGQEGLDADHRARTVIAVSFACADAATATWVASEGTGEPTALFDEALAVMHSGPDLC